MCEDAFPKEVTIGEKYGPAMEIRTKEEAAEYLMKCINHTMDCRPELSIDEARKIELENIGYYTGYYDPQTAERVYKLFKTEHPLFGRVWPSPEKAFEMGKRVANR